MSSCAKHLAVILLSLAALASGQTSSRNRIAGSIDDSSAVSLKGNVHPLARAQYDQGRVNPGLAIRGASLVFQPSAEQKKELKTLLRQQQNPGSANYHKWLTPEQYADRFGLSKEDIGKVASWLGSKGLTVDRVARGRTQIYFHGTAAQIERALHTQIHSYLVGGKNHFANANEPAIPAALSGVVVAVRNLNDFRPKPRNLRVKQQLSGVQPRLTTGDGSHFLTPDDVAIIYNLQPLYDLGLDGTGQSIAVVGQTEISQADISAFRTASGLSSNPVQFVLVPGTGASTVSQDDLTEASLDVEWSGAVGREATIFYVYTGNSTSFNVIDAIQYSIDNNIAPVISISYGLCEADAGSANASVLQSWAQQANSQGQTLSAASGDLGAADCEDASALSATHGLAVDLPGAVPEVTSVGGTRFSGDASNPATYWNATNGPHFGSAISYIPETTWNDSTQTIASGDGFSATGGGVSTFFSKPSFQTALTPNDSKRDVPDVSFAASVLHDAYLVCSNGSCVNGGFTNGGNPAQILVVGGTSVGSPVFAGLASLINQATQSGGQGNANEELYAVAESTPAAFHDVTTGDNKVPCTSGSTGCTEANSHMASVGSGGLLLASGIFLVSTCGIWVPKRKRGLMAIAGLFTVALLAASVGCGGGGGSNDPPPPTNISIGYSAGTGYDLTTGLGSVDAQALVTAWTGAVLPSAFAYQITSLPPAINGSVGVNNATLTVTRVGTFTGTVALTCRVIPLNTSSTCSLNPASVNLTNGAGQSSTLTVNATPAGTYTVVVKGTSGSFRQFANVRVTVQ